MESEPPTVGIADSRYAVVQVYQTGCNAVTCGAEVPGARAARVPRSTFIVGVPFGTLPATDSGQAGRDICPFEMIRNYQLLARVSG